MSPRGRESPFDRLASGKAGRRATSITLNYVLALGIASILVTGLILAGGGFVENQRERAVESELNVIGAHVAGSIEQVDRYVEAGEGDNVTARIDQQFQRQVSGTQYTITLLEPDGPDAPARLELEATDTDVSVTVNVSARIDVEQSTASGGTVAVAYDEDGDAVVIRSA